MSKILTHVEIDEGDRSEGFQIKSSPISSPGMSLPTKASEMIHAASRHTFRGRSV